MKLSDYVIRFIADLGIKHVFLVVGGGAMHLNDSLADCDRIEYVCNLHEQASAIAAENYAKATNHLGAALVTTGPGGTNTITGLAGAWLDSTPCLFVSGQVKRADSMFAPDGTPLGVRNVGVQEVDIVSIVTPITKYAVTINDPQSIRYHLEKAAYLAQTGRPGPVWIDIPLDVQAMPIEPESLPAYTPPTKPSDNTNGLSDLVDKVISALNNAERPVLLVGNGVRLARAEPEMLALIAGLKVPVETTWLAIDIVSNDNEWYVGRPGSIAARGANFAIQNADFVLAIGARLDRVVTGFAPERFARAAYKVMVDIDPYELAKMGDSVHLKVEADAGDFMRAMLDKRETIVGRDRAGWKARCDSWNIRYPLVLDEHRAPDQRVSTYYLSEVLSEEMREGDYLVSGSSGSGIELFLLAFHCKKNQRVFHTTNLGAMGFGLPAAIGAAVAGMRDTVVVDGDGGFQFNIQELETVARLQLPIKFFILNNNGYASIRASQTAFFGSPKIGCDRATGQSLPDIRRIAEAHGLQSDIIADQRNLRAEVRRVLDTPGPVVCDVRSVLDEVRQPRLSSVQRPNGSFVSRPLEDLWPFLDRDVFAAEMVVPVMED